MRKGWDKYTFSLPQKVRASHYNDVVYGPEWKQLLADFDAKPFGANTVSDLEYLQVSSPAKRKSSQSLTKRSL